jgi:hypothetical protein
MSSDPPRVLVADLPRLPLLIVGAETSLREVGAAMLRRQTSPAVVAQTGAIITERDLRSWDGPCGNGFRELVAGDGVFTGPRLGRGPAMDLRDRDLRLWARRRPAPRLRA